ncbi:MAG TPA: CHASE3 domain-containing protein [Thermomicrobiales bacterium]|nr:CHASE3 domain-containing protein [Thermomicrobiales bacterium]
MTPFSNLSLRWKLLGSFALVLIILAGMSIAAYRTTVSNEHADDAESQTLETIDETNATYAALLDMESGYRGFLLTGQDRFLDPYFNGKRDFENLLSMLMQRSQDSSSELARWRDIAQRAETWQQEIIEPGIQIRRDVNAGAAEIDAVTNWVSTNAGRQQVDDMREIFAEAIDAERAVLDERQQEAADENARLRQTLIFGTLLAVVLGVGMALLLARDVVGGVGRLARSAERIAGGDLTERTGLRRNDEVGDAAAAFDRMADQLQRSVIERDQREQDLARSNAELEQFAYVASHDLQEPLRAVVSYVQLLEKRYKDQLDERASKYIAYAVDGGQRMQTLINDLLTYSRVGRANEEFEPVDMEHVLDRAITSVRVAVEESEAVITHDPLPVVTADERMLTQLFQNLLSNAIKFSGDRPPRVHVSAARQPDEWLFAVRDEGIGIAPEYAQRIFVIFQRLHGRDEYPGTGIGLAICKKIVDRHGGRLWVESTFGAGATFYFTLLDPDPGDVTA